MKIVGFIVLLFSLLSAMAWIFWQQEWRYSQPTPKPPHWESAITNKRIDETSRSLLGVKSNRVLVHFYNYDCPCSRFNMKEFNSLVLQYQDEVEFVAVLQTDDDMTAESIKQFEEKYGLGIRTLVDKKGQIANALGVYSTPQAVILDGNTIYFKGNYNAARFCTTKNTRFVAIALKALLNNEPLPMLPTIAEVAYGCELPAHANEKPSFLKIFTY